MSIHFVSVLLWCCNEDPEERRPVALWFEINSELLDLSDVGCKYRRRQNVGADSSSAAVWREMSGFIVEPSGSVMDPL